MSVRMKSYDTSKIKDQINSIIDWYDLEEDQAKDLKGLLKNRNSLKKENKLLKECVEFYADKENWKSQNQHKGTRQKITNTDIGREDFSQMYFIMCGGNKAREVLEKIKGDK